MSEIPFVNLLGDELETAFSTRRRARVRAGLPRPTNRRGGLIVALVVLVIAGGAAAATILANPTTTLVARGVSCISPDGSATYNLPLGGSGPVTVCSGPLHTPSSRLVACTDPSSGVVVYVSDGSAKQCESRGLAPFSGRDRSSYQLVHHLYQPLYNAYAVGTGCQTPGALARKVDLILNRAGLAGWHAHVNHSNSQNSQYPGRCGAYPSDARGLSDPTAALDASSDTVEIDTGPSRHFLLVLGAAAPLAIRYSNRECYSLAATEALARYLVTWFATNPSNPRPQGVHSIPPLRFEPYGGAPAGCAAASEFETTSNGHEVIVHIHERPTSATPIATRPSIKLPITRTTTNVRTSAP